MECIGSLGVSAGQFRESRESRESREIVQLTPVVSCSLATHISRLAPQKVCQNFFLWPLAIPILSVLLCLDPLMLICILDTMTRTGENMTNTIKTTLRAAILNAQEVAEEADPRSDLHRRAWSIRDRAILAMEMRPTPEEAQKLAEEALLLTME